MDTKTFANSIREQDPEGVTSDGLPFSKMSDTELTHRIVKKYPVYKAQISDYRDPTAGGNVVAPKTPGYRANTEDMGMIDKGLNFLNEVTGVGDLAAKAGEKGLNYLAKNNPDDQILQDAAKNSADNQLAPNEQQMASAGLKFSSALAAPFTGGASILGAGYAQNVANNLDEGVTTTKEALTPGWETAVASIPIVGKQLTKMGPLANALEKRTANFIEDLITPELNKNKTIQAIKTGKVEDKGLFGGRDITEAVPFYDEMKKAVSEVPGLKKGQTMLQSANKIHEYIGSLGDQLKNQIKLHQVTFTPEEFTGFMTQASKKLEEIPSLTRDASEVATKYLNQFNKLVNKNGYTAEGLLTARREFDKLLPSKKLSPDIENGITEAVRNIRQGANEFLANKVPNVEVKNLLAKQTALYNALDNVAAKAVAEGSTSFQRFAASHPTFTKVSKNLGYIGLGAAGLGGVNQVLGDR